MKKIIVYFIFLFCLSVHTFSQQQQSKSGVDKLLHLIVTISDSVREMYPYRYQCFSAWESDSVYYTINHKSELISLYFPAIRKPLQGRMIFEKLDSLAKTYNYCNKVFAHKMYFTMLTGLIREEDSLSKTNKDTLQTARLISDIINSDLDNCVRYTDAKFTSPLKHRNLTPEILNKLMMLFRNPFHTLEEAKVIAQRQEPKRFVPDTTGYAKKRANFYNLNEEGKEYTRKVESAISKAEKAKLTLFQYRDSLQKDWNLRAINGALTERIDLMYIVQDAGQKYFYELAPAIEKFYLTGIEKKWDEVENCRINLARLQYKNYEQILVDEKVKGMDTTIKYLKKQISNDQQKDALNDLYGLFRNLIYINTQNSYYATAPLLLLTVRENECTDCLRNRSILAASRFFLELNRYIMNFPWDKQKYNGGDVDEFYIENEMPKGFLEGMYNWMIENRGKYIIDKNF
jgi:hypothetical protein